ncbi:MAG: hypothetical protein ACREMZ_16730 [Gemmatimonadales bacterium]
MTRDKAQKRATRVRMAKTGERYTAARRHVVKPNEELHAEDLGRTDAAVRQNTGKGWREWLSILDGWGARERKHGDIVRHLLEEHSVPGWWAQSITVGYERARGMRAKYQRATGFTVSISKTFNVDVGKLHAAFTDARQRNKWLERGTLKVRTTQKAKTARFDYQDGSSRVIAYFESKERAKSTVTVEHERLPDATAVEEMRAMWKERLSELARLIQS